jgi:hypothetical protein
MQNKLRKLLVQYAVENNIEIQQALRSLITNLKLICISLDLDFDSALDKSDPLVDFIENGCDHQMAYPCNNDSIYCPNCGEYLLKGKMAENPDWLKQNHWR